MGLSKDKGGVLALAKQGQLVTSPPDVFKDPYVLEFTGLAERPHYVETDLEQALLDHLQAFLLELGEGFCFEARQRRITISGDHDYIDLVFYHRLLRCHVLIDLKTRKFRPRDAGQMNFYLNYYRQEIMPEVDNLPVGLILGARLRGHSMNGITAGPVRPPRAIRGCATHSDGTRPGWAERPRRRTQRR